jgi:SAM-dependent methyltransferase
VHRSLAALLRDPDSGARLSLQVCAADGEAVQEGVLVGERAYPIVRGIPRFVEVDDEGQRQTQGSFAFKWSQRDTYTSEAVRAQARRWLLERYGFGSVDELQGRFRDAGRVLDAGCGGGYSASLWLSPGWRGASGVEWIGADISTAVDVACDRLSAAEGTHFVQADLMRLPFAPGTFDVIFSEGVLHHTPSTANAFAALVPLLAHGGELMFYVYRRKAPAREFTDDHIRAEISRLPPDEAWDALRPLTELGRALADLNASVVVPSDIPYLGIAAGRYDVQRLIYWHFLKAFWNPDLSFDENHHVNFDWHHPRYAHRHTEAEVREWCEAARLSIVRFDAQDSGFTVRAVRR